jgi:hypothetical protein
MIFPLLVFVLKHGTDNSRLSLAGQPGMANSSGDYLGGTGVQSPFSSQ